MLCKFSLDCLYFRRLDYKLGQRLLIRTLSTGFWSPSSCLDYPHQDDSETAVNKMLIGVLRKKVYYEKACMIYTDAYSLNPTSYSSYLGKGIFSWSCLVGGLGSRPWASISCLVCTELKIKFTMLEKEVATVNNFSQKASLLTSSPLPAWQHSLSSTGSVPGSRGEHVREEWTSTALRIDPQ